MSQRRRQYRYAWLTLASMFVACVALLTIGALSRQRAYVTRGIPAGPPPPIPHGGAELGVNVYLQQYDDGELTANLAAIRALGIRKVKQSFHFVDPFDWREADRIFAAVNAQGLTLVPLLDGDPDTDYAPPDEPSRFADWAARFASRYGDQVEYYIIWDEPNLASHWGDSAVNPAEYGALLAAASSAIREADADAVIVAAPLAPTVETAGDNLADVLYLEQLYAAGAGDAFDVVAGKPYGFNEAPDDRAVSLSHLNFSRIILLREVVEGHGDEQKAVWAGNWGWNSLPPDWRGQPSIWGQTDEDTRAAYTTAALERARREWPWMGLMFLENWEPDAPPNDAHWGFGIAGRPVAQIIADFHARPQPAYPGFHLAQQNDPRQSFSGGWRFSADYGADVDSSGDSASIRFWGTDVGLRVRRADSRARLHVMVDGKPANALPSDGKGAALVLSNGGAVQDRVDTEWVAHGLAPGEHTLTLVAQRGRNQWALNGFSVAYNPPSLLYPVSVVVLALFAVAAFIIASRSARLANWGWVRALAMDRFRSLGDVTQIAITFAIATLVAVAGWMTWGEQAAGVYRRLGDLPQLAFTAAAASVFYFSPNVLLYLASLAVLFLLIYARPAWGLALIAFSFPLYVVPKPMLGYRFSPVEVFVLVTGAALSLRTIVRFGQEARRPVPGSQHSKVSRLLRQKSEAARRALLPADIAVLIFVVVAAVSLLFTERIEVAENEFRMVILEPALFYAMMRFAPLTSNEMKRIIDAFIAGGVAVAAYGLFQYARGENVITVAGGLSRLRSIYGSPNNVGLYLGRVLPILAAVAFVTRDWSRRRIVYTAAILPIALALLLTYSKGSLFLGVPASLLVVLVLWRRDRGGKIWPWLVGAVLAGVTALLIALRVPAIANRLDPQGYTSFLRLNLWRSSVQMFADHPVFGVGLDNFLYEYRERYILEAAWAEPNLSHPHNIVLDFATRLGVIGLAAGIALLGMFLVNLWRSLREAPPGWSPITIGIAGAFANMIAHGLVDHSFFLVDLSLSFYLFLGIVVWLNNQAGNTDEMPGPSSVA